MTPVHAAVLPWPARTDAEWVAAVRAGEPAAFEALFHAYHAPLCTFAHRYLGARDLAEEIVQEVFLFVWERRETWDVRTSVRSYLFTAVRNAAKAVGRTVVPARALPLPFPVTATLENLRHGRRGALAERASLGPKAKVIVPLSHCLREG